VRTAYLNQLIVDLNAQIEATMLIVTHDVNTARTVPDNIGLLYRRHLAMFGPREMLLSSHEPVVHQFLNARRQGPIGMAEEKDAAELEAEKSENEELPGLPPIPPQITPSNGEPRKTQREAGAWLRENNVEPPPGSFSGSEGYGEASAPPASTEGGSSKGGSSKGSSAKGGKGSSGKASSSKGSSDKDSSDEGSSDNDGDHAGQDSQNGSRSKRESIRVLRSSGSNKADQDGSGDNGQPKKTASRSRAKKAAARGSGS
jgi:hypothetical protein